MADDKPTISLDAWAANEPPKGRPGVAGLPRGGAAIGRYVVLGPVASGGMGAVLAAWDPSLDRRVALKLLLPDLGRPDAVQRLHREAQAMARLNHPNVATVHDVGTVDGRPYVAMEFVEGCDLAAWLSREPRSWQAVLALFRAAGEGLAAAHAAGIVHRDFKPSNVMVGDDGRVRVTDFGLARAIGARPEPAGDDGQSPPSPPRAAGASPLDSDLTREGAVLGTPAYMAPEQMVDGHADARADQFAFCVALYEALYGRHPFADAHNPAGVAARAAAGVPDPPAGSPAPAWLLPILRRGLALDPAARHPDMTALLAALDDDPARRRRRRMVRIAAVVLLALLAGGWGIGRLVLTRRCAALAARAAAVLDGNARARVAARFTAVAGERGARSAAATIGFLDGYLERWADAAARCCRRGFPWRGARDPDRVLEGACLDRSLQTVAELVPLLAGADAELVGSADTAVLQLAPPEACEVVAAAPGRLPPPTTAAAVAQLDDIRHDLARAKALWLAGDFQQRREVLSKAVDKAEAAAYPPVTADVLTDYGIAAVDLGDVDEGVESFRQALAKAELGRDDAAGAQAATHLAWVRGELDTRFEDAYRWRDLAEAKLARIGGDPQVAAELASVMGAVLLNAGDYEGAVAAQRRVLELATQLEGPTGIDTAHAHHRLGVALAELGRSEEAVAEYRTAIELKRAILGDDHPELAPTLSSLADALIGLDRAGGAAPLAEEALRIQEAALGPEHPEIAKTLDTLAVAYEELGRLGDARRLYERAIAITSSALGADHAQVGYAALNLASLLARLDDLPAAIVQAERAARIFHAQLGDDHPHTAYAENNTGMLLLKAGRARAAVPHLEQALEIRSAATVAPVLLEETRFNLARAAWAAGQRTRGRKLARDAETALAGLDDDGAEALARVRTWLADPGS